MDSSGSFWAGIPLDDEGTHVTIIVRRGVPREDAMMLAEEMRQVLGPLMPMAMRIDPEVRMRGPDLDVPTHDVQFLAPYNAHHAIADLYARTYKVLPGEASFPVYAAHVSVKKPECAAAVRRILYFQGGAAMVSRAELRSWDDDDDSVLFAVVAESAE